MYKLIAISSPELSDLMAALVRSYAQWRRAPGVQNALLMHPCSFDLHTVEAPGGDTPDLKLRGLSKDIFGFERFMIPGFFRVRKFGKCFFWLVWFKAIWTSWQCPQSRSQSSANKVQPNLLRLGNSACMHGIFLGGAGGGVNLWSRLVLLEALGLRGGFGQFSPLFDHSCHLKSGVLPWE